MSVWPLSIRLAPPPVPGSVGDRLETPGLDLLELDAVAALAKELGEEARDGRFLGLEARDANQRAGEIDQARRVDPREHALLCRAIRPQVSRPIRRSSVPGAVVP